MTKQQENTEELVLQGFDLPCANLLSYNQMKAIYGDNDQQVQDIKRHLDNISISTDGTVAYSNYDLEAFKRISNE